MRILDSASISKNPLLAKAFIKTLSPSDLLYWMNDASGRGELLLNNESVIEGLLESEDDGKLLLLAAASKIYGDSFQLRECDRFMSLYQRSAAHKAALVGNTQFNWYSFLVFNSAVVLKLVLEDVFKQDSQLKRPFYSNPKMDRKLIASIIRAGKYHYDFTFFDLTAVSFAERYTACTLSLPVEKERDDESLFDWMREPSDSDLYFEEPYSALLSFIRDLFLAWDDPDSGADYYLTNLIYYTDLIQIGFDADEWIANDEKGGTFDDGESHWDSIEKKSSSAFVNVIKFFEKHTSSYKQEGAYEKGRDSFRYYSRVCMVITLLPQLLSVSSLARSISTNIEALLQSKSWVLRASAYSWVFKNLDNSLESQTMEKFIEKYSKDSYALVWGIVCSSHYQLLAKIDRSVIESKDNLIDALNFDDTARKLFDDYQQFLFSNKYRSVSADVLERNYRSSLVRRSQSIKDYINLSFNV